MILNFDRGYGQSAEQMVQSLMASTQMAFDTLERKLGLSGGFLIDDDGNVITDKIEANNVITDKIEANDVAVKGGLALGTALSITNGGTGATTAAAARTNLEVKKYTTKNFTSSSQSVSANSYKNIGFSISLDGYKPLGIIAINNGVFELAVIRFMCSSTDASVVLRNVTSNAKNVSVTIAVLYEEV